MYAEPVTFILSVMDHTVNKPNEIDTSRFIFLKSVGTWIDPDTCLLYSMLPGGNPDIYSGLKISKVHNNWIASLSPEDYETIVSL
jgi:hypothetical protein